MERLYTVDETAKYFGVSRQTIYIWMNTGRLAWVEFGGRRRIRQSTLDTFLIDHLAERAA